MAFAEITQIGKNEGGIYSGIMEYEQDGTDSLRVRVDNNQNQARYTAEGMSPAHSFAPGQSDSIVEPDLDTVGRDFERMASLSVTA